MSDPYYAETPSPNEVDPASQEQSDAEQLQSAGDTDQDELAVDPLEQGREPPEGWSVVSRNRPTPHEMREGGANLEEELAQERPDTEPEPATPVGETRLFELDDSVDEQARAEVADGVDEDEYADRSVDAEHGAVLEGDQVEPTGMTATSAEGVDVADTEASGRAPEEDAERVEDSGR